MSASIPAARQRTPLRTLAIAWAVLFGIAHAYWAVGGTLGVPGGTEPISQRPVFLAYDIVSGVLCLQRPPSWPPPPLPAAASCS